MRHLSSKSTRLLLAFVMLGSCIGCDQATKQIATQTLRGALPCSYLANTLRLEYSLNPGAFLSLGSGLPPRLRFWLFTVANATLLIAAAWFLARQWNMRLGMFVALVSFFAGGVGNLIDRVLHDGSVTDFLNLGIGPLRTGIFNVADVAITMGAVAFVLLHWHDAGASEPPASSA